MGASKFIHSDEPYKDIIRIEPNPLNQNNQNISKDSIIIILNIRLGFIYMFSAFYSWITKF